MSEPAQESPTFTESLRAPGWMFAFLGLMLGGTSGVLTAVGIRSIGDDPLVSGPEALIFYLCFAIAILGIVYVMLGSTLMQTTATARRCNRRSGHTWDTPHLFVVRYHRDTCYRPQHSPPRRTR